MSEILAFYSGLNVLITGGTGLLGQLLIQKLLRACDDIGDVYLIIRGKKGKSAEERMKEAFQNPVFDRLKKEVPKFSEKIHVMSGDCSLLDLGLSETNRKLLGDKINVVFHCAANLNMDATMKEAVITNVRGLKQLLGLCRQMSSLKSMMFVSTAYSNCNNPIIEERFYEPPIKPATLLALTESINDTVMDNITSGLMSTWPNTYCYSKVVAENLFYTETDNLPAGLFRPSIILSTYSDPVPGWMSNIYGPIGIRLAAGLGLLRVTRCENDFKLDYVPADLCVNALIAAAWEVHLKSTSIREVPVYNYSAGLGNCITWGFLGKTSLESDYPYNEALWVPFVVQVSNKFCYDALHLVLHLVPGCIIDAILTARGKKARLWNIYKKIYKFQKVVQFFSMKEWQIINENSANLWNRLNDTDKQTFPFDMEGLDHRKLILDGCLGIKLYILKENLDNIEVEKKRLRRWHKIDELLKVTLIVLLLLGLFKIFGLFI